MKKFKVKVESFNNHEWGLREVEDYVIEAENEEEVKKIVHSWGGYDWDCFPIQIEEIK